MKINNADILKAIYSENIYDSLLILLDMDESELNEQQELVDILIENIAMKSTNFKDKIPHFTYSLSNNSVFKNNKNGDRNLLAIYPNIIYDLLYFKKMNLNCIGYFSKASAYKNKESLLLLINDNLDDVVEYTYNFFIKNKSDTLEIYPYNKHINMDYFEKATKLINKFKENNHNISIKIITETNLNNKKVLPYLFKLESEPCGFKEFLSNNNINFDLNELNFLKKETVDFLKTNDMIKSELDRFIFNYYGYELLGENFSLSIDSILLLFKNTEYTKEILLDLLGDTYGLIYEKPLRNNMLLELLDI